MLRRRILASAMASVMAIGSVAVVANAEDATATTQVKSKTDLEGLVKDMDKVVDDLIYNYGTVAANNFQDAYDYAVNVIADINSTSVEYTVAYAMLESVSNPTMYGTDDLKKLIDLTKNIYESENILNDDLDDLIYDEGTFKKFSDAFEEAEDVVNSSDSRLITDAYIGLKNTYEGLKKLDVVTKQQFRNALKSYEALYRELNKYEDWRRGKQEGWYDDDLTSNYWVYQQQLDPNGCLEFGLVKDMIFGVGQFETDFGWAVVKTVVLPNGGEDTVKDYINEAYDKFCNIETASKTSDTYYVDAYRTAVRAVEIFNNFKADDTNRATKASVSKILEQYHNQLVAKYNTTGAAEVYKIVNGKDELPKGWQGDTGNKFYGAELTNEGKRVKKPINGKDVTIAAGGDILKYVTVTSTDVANYIDDNGSSDLDERVLKALQVAEAYTKAEKNEDYDLKDLDETNSIPELKGSIAEWTLVYRYLKYALEDSFKTSVSVNTKRQVNELIDSAYELADKTGDAEKFATLHLALVTARQEAQNWMREANSDKKYADDKLYNGKNATMIYTTLNDAYKKLDELFGKYAYSYQEIYDYIAQVKSDIDDGELKATDTLTEALKNTAYALTTLTPKDEDTNLAFTSDREWCGYNRLNTGDSPNGSEKALKAAYEALQAAVKAQDVKKVLGDVDGDGDVDVFDAQTVLKKYVNGEVDTLDKETADYDKDGDIDVLDAAAILKAYVNS